MNYPEPGVPWLSLVCKSLLKSRLGNAWNCLLFQTDIIFMGATELRSCFASQMVGKPAISARGFTITECVMEIFRFLSTSFRAGHARN